VTPKPDRSIWVGTRQREIPWSSALSVGLTTDCDIESNNESWAFCKEVIISITEEVIKERKSRTNKLL
jgi:hypothetical protein